MSGFEHGRQINILCVVCIITDSLKGAAYHQLSQHVKAEPEEKPDPLYYQTPINGESDPLYYQILTNGESDPLYYQTSTNSESDPL